MKCIKKWAKKFGKWGLILFILFEISQMTIGGYFGIKFALETIHVDEPVEKP